MGNIPVLTDLQVRRCGAACRPHYIALQMLQRAVFDDDAGREDAAEALPLALPYLKVLDRAIGRTLAAQRTVLSIIDGKPPEGLTLPFRFLSANQAAAALHISRATLDAWVRWGLVRPRYATQRSPHFGPWEMALLEVVYALRQSCYSIRWIADMLGWLLEEAKWQDGLPEAALSHRQNLLLALRRRLRAQRKVRQALAWLLAEAGQVQQGIFHHCDFWRGMNPLEPRRLLAFVRTRRSRRRSAYPMP